MTARLPLALLLASVFGASAHAVTLNLPGGEGERQRIDYSCSDGTDRSVEYVNLTHDSLALLDIDGETRLFVSVISGSGARYVSGEFEWWTKGPEATLRNAMADEGTADITCGEAESAG